MPTNQRTTPDSITGTRAGEPRSVGEQLANAGSALTGSVDTRRMLWLGGLAALGVLGVIEWPVAAVVGVGSYVAERLAKDDVRTRTHLAE